MWWLIVFAIVLILFACIPSAETRQKMKLIEMLDRPRPFIDPSNCCAMVADCDCRECKYLEERRRENS